MADEPKADTGADGTKASRSFSARAERSLKDADRMMKKNPDRPAEEQAAAQVEQAKVWALLHLADSIRESRAS